MPRWRDSIVPSLIGWVWARLCIALGFLIAGQTVTVLDNPGGHAMIRQGLFVWDGAYYRVLSQVWYGGANPDAARFFPLYPQLARLLAPVFGGNDEIALLVISNLSALLGAMVLWMLTAEMLERARHGGQDHGVSGGQDPGGGQVGVLDSAIRSTADRSAWMIAIFPAAFVFTYAYTESLALVLTAGTLLALLRKQFFVAALLAFGAAILRPVGGLLLVAIAVELWECRPRPALLKSLVALAAPVAGLVSAFVWIWVSTDDLLRPLRLQGEIRRGFQDPITRMLEPIGELLKGDFRDTYNLGFMIVFAFLAYQAVRFRQPRSWLAFMFASLLVLQSSQVTDSLGRYGVIVVPLVVALAQWADVRWKQVAYGAGASVMLAWIVSEAMIGRLVP